MRVRDIMSTDIVTLPPQATIREAMELLATRHVSGAPVMSGETILGVVTANDLMALTAALPGVPTGRDAHEGWIDSALPLVAADEDLEAEASGAYFSELWEDAGADVSERMADVSTPEWNVLEEHDVSEVMTRPPLTTVEPDASAEVAADLMRRYAIHRVLVTQGDRLLGVVSSLDIARAAAEHGFNADALVPDPLLVGVPCSVLVVAENISRQ